MVFFYFILKTVQLEITKSTDSFAPYILIKSILALL